MPSPMWRLIRLIRLSEYNGHKVKYVQNVTDIDDDVLRKARELGMEVG